MMTINPSPANLIVSWTALEPVKTSVLLEALARRSVRSIARLGYRVRHNYRTRQELRDLNDELLRDIGITRDQALREAERFVWKSDWR